MLIPHTSLPEYNDLFIDYVTNFKLVEKYYNFYYDKSGFDQSIGQKKSYLEECRISRIEIAEILKEQNKFYNSSETCFSNIELLKNSNSYAIVTGQQIGILTGNLYTIYKAINTVQLSRRLSVQFPDYNFIPVFWLETDDHDFLEINNINILDTLNNPSNISYFEKGIEKERYLTPVGNIILDYSINSFIDKLESSLTKTEFTPQLFEFIRKSYRDGIGLTTAFARFFNYIAGDLGIVFINPSQKEIKKMLLPIFEKELMNYPKVSETVISTSATLELDYEPQVKPKPINLFFTYNNNRHLIEPKEEGFSLRNTRQKYSKEEFFNLLYSYTENFSANVILRPVCQDYLLPTIAYIAGPGETAYFAQFKEVYEFFGLKMPVIYPRTTVTLIEKRTLDILNKFNLGFEDLFDESGLKEKIINKINETKPDEIFSSLDDEISAVIYTHCKDLEKIDKNLVNNLKNKADKFKDNLSVLKQKFVESLVQQNESTIKKVNSVINNVYPSETFQERFLNITYFINKYGFDLIGNLLNNIDIDKFNHQVFVLPFDKSENQGTLFEKL